MTTVSEVSNMIGTSPDTLRRWCTEEYTAFLSPGATPGKGEVREFNTHDLRVLNYVATKRRIHRPHGEIREDLARFQAGGWAELPDVPEEWQQQTTGQITVAEAGERASHVAELTALTVENRNLRDRLQEARESVDQLQSRLQAVERSERATAGEVNDLRVQLSDARGEVNTLQARLQAYAITGDTPTPVALIIVAALVAGAVLVALALVLARLVLV